MDHHTRTEFRLEPGGLRRHDVARIGNVDELLHGNRVECESRLHLAAIDTLLQLFQAANTADEIDPFRRPQILDVEQLVEYQVRQHGYVQHSDRIVVIVRTRLRREAIPLTVEVERKVVQLRRVVDLLALGFHGEILLQRLEELLGSHPVQVFHHAVVVDDAKLARRERNGQEIAVFLVAGMVGVALLTLLAHTGSGSGTMVC